MARAKAIPFTRPLKHLGLEAIVKMVLLNIPNLIQVPQNKPHRNARKGSKWASFRVKDSCVWLSLELRDDGLCRMYSGVDSKSRGPVPVSYEQYFSEESDAGALMKSADSALKKKLKEGADKAEKGAYLFEDRDNFYKHVEGLAAAYTDFYAYTKLGEAKFARETTVLSHYNRNKDSAASIAFASSGLVIYIETYSDKLSMWLCGEALAKPTGSSREEKPSAVVDSYEALNKTLTDEIDNFLEERLETMEVEEAVIYALSNTSSDATAEWMDDSSQVFRDEPPSKSHYDWKTSCGSRFSFSFRGHKHVVDVLHDKVSAFTLGEDGDEKIIVPRLKLHEFSEALGKYLEEEGSKLTDVTEKAKFHKLSSVDEILDRRVYYVRRNGASDEVLPIMYQARMEKEYVRFVGPESSFLMVKNDSVNDAIRSLVQQVQRTNSKNRPFSERMLIRGRVPNGFSESDATLSDLLAAVGKFSEVSVYGPVVLDKEVGLLLP